jgi:hypothetical protein
MAHRRRGGWGAARGVRFGSTGEIGQHALGHGSLQQPVRVCSDYRRWKDYVGHGVHTRTDREAGLQPRSGEGGTAVGRELRGPCS